MSPDGEVKWEKQKSVEARGSHEAALHVSKCPIRGTLVIDGNPAKFLQGHNCFGVDDVPALVAAVSLEVMQRLGIEPSPVDLDNIARGFIELSRVDVTNSFCVGSMSAARACVRALADVATMRHRGRGQLTREGTCYFSKHSRRSSLKVYAKGHELMDHPISHTVEARDQVKQWAESMLRFELVLRSMALKDLHLDLVANWKPDTPFNLWRDAMDKLNIPANLELPVEMVDGMKSRHRLAYVAWLHGEDLRATMPARSFYRLRTEMLQFGVDIVTLRPAEKRSNVVPLVRVIEAIPAGIPEWAVGTSLLFEGRKVA
jgi:II/X family phage/plasmid replication protein